MQFAHLKRIATEYGETLGPTETDGMSNVALLKARTMLSFLYDKGLLDCRADDAEEWLMYYPKGIDFGPVPKMDELSEEVVAVLPTKLHMPTWEQPGLAMIKNSLAVKTLFIEAFLDSSRKWLEKNPGKLREIEENMRPLLVA